MKTVRSLDLVSVKQQALPYQGDALFSLEGRHFGGLILNEAHRAILSQMASVSAFGNKWSPIRLDNVQYRFGLSEQELLVAADQLENKKLVEVVSYKGTIYFVPTEDYARGLWLAYTEDRLQIED